MLTNKIKYYLYGILIITFLISVLIGRQNLYLEPNPSEAKFLHVQGNKIFDEKGNEIILRGVDEGPLPYFSFKSDDFKGVYSNEKINEFNKNLYSAFLTEQDMIRMKEMGVNVIRTHLSFYHLEVEPYKYNEGELGQLDYLLNISSKYGIYVIPVLSDAAQNSEQQLAHPEDEVSKAYNNTEHLWTEPEFQKRVLAAWKHIAQRYANEPGIAGYDIINEPSAPTKEDLHSFYSKVISEIRKVDTKHIIILEKQHFHNGYEFLFGGIYPDNNIMLSLHQYADETLEVEGANPNANYPSYDDLHKALGDFLKQEEVKGRPLYVGEFGIAFARDEAYEWLDNMMQVMNSYGVYYTYFSYKNVYGYWDKLKGESKGLYQSTEPLFFVPQNIPKEQVIDWAEERKDQLLTEGFQIDSRIKEILRKNLK